ASWEKTLGWISGGTKRSPAVPDNPCTHALSFDLAALVQHLVEKRNVFQLGLRRFERPDVRPEIRRVPIRQARHPIARHRFRRSGRWWLAGARRADEPNEFFERLQPPDEGAVFLNEPHIGFTVGAMTGPALMRRIEC